MTDLHLPFPYEICVQPFNWLNEPAVLDSWRFKGEIELAEFLKDRATTIFKDKTDNFLICPASFGEQLNKNGNRTSSRENEICARGIYLDIDDGSLSLEKVQTIFRD